MPTKLHPKHKQAVAIFDLFKKKAPLQFKLQILKADRDTMLNRQDYALSEELVRKIKETQDNLKSLQQSINKRKKASGLKKKDVARILLDHEKISQSPRRLISRSDLEKKRQERSNKEKTINSVNIETVNWTLLPVGTDWATFEDNFNEQLTKSGGNFEQKAIDETKERFKCIFELKPKSIYRGFETFSDYFALLFEDTDKVVLESVNYGNAIYIIEGDWKILSRRTKAELKTSNKTKVIHHRSDWFSKLKNYLQIGFK